MRSALNIWHSRRTVPVSHGRIMPMSPVDAKAWERTRELHPHLYRKETAR